jgi:quercetin dioxygenase-like cupin family protein
MRTKLADRNVVDHTAPAVRRRPHAPSMASPFLEFDLAAEVDQLRREKTWSTGRNARTLVKYHDFRVVLTALQAHMRIPEHTTDGRISIHMLSGHVRLNASGRTFDLRPGSLVALDQGSSHDIEALEESAFLLTIAWRGRPVDQP